MLKVVILFFYCFSLRALALPRLVVLTSLNEDKLERRMEKIIRKKLSSFDTQIIHNARQEELYAALVSGPDALIWVSHGMAPFTPTSFGVRPEVLDFEGDNVAPIFQSLTPSTQFLGIVSCYSEMALLDQRVNRVHLKKTYLSKKRILAMSGFRRAIKNLLATDFHEEGVKEEMPILDTLLVRRSASMRGVRVFQQNRFLGLAFQEGIFFSTTPIKGNIRLELPREKKFQESAWGNPEVYLNGEELSVFAGPTGKPLGTWSRVFR